MSSDGTTEATQVSRRPGSRKRRPRGRAAKAQRRRMGVGMVVCLLLYLLVYVGWWLHDCPRPVVGPYSLEYCAFLLVMALPFAAPLLWRWTGQALGIRRRNSLAILSAMGLGGSYMIASFVLSQRETHAFDPFLQAPPLSLAKYPQTKPPGVCRIVTLGGSTTRNRRLADEDQYPNVLKEVLERSLGCSPTQISNRAFAIAQPGGEKVLVGADEDASYGRIEILNAGMDWYTSAHSLIHYTTYVRRWDPDIIVVMHGINDVMRSFSPPDYAHGGYTDRYAHFYGPAYRGARPPTLAGRLLKPMANCWASRLRYQECDFPLSRYVSQGAFEDNLRALVRYAQADGVRVVLVTQPTLLQPDRPAEADGKVIAGAAFCTESAGIGRRRFASPESLEHAMAAYRETVSRVAREEGALLAKGYEAVPPSLECFRDEVHYLPTGARCLANAVARSIYSEARQVLAKGGPAEAPTTLGLADSAQELRAEAIQPAVLREP
jgi:lysophospholipase L1-like esterase